MDPRNISISDYSYSLPEERIAKYPLAERDASRLLIYKNGSITEDIYRRIANQLPGNSLMVFNNTKVIEARLLFPKQTGGIIEIFCLEPAGQYQDVAKAMEKRECVLWKCMIGGASKWRPGTILEKKIRAGKEEMVMKAAIRDRLADSFLIELNWGPSHLSFAEVLHFAGAMPLPPYIKREAEEADTERYQTIYAKESGSVAAPTAGLHFTEPIFEDLRSKNIQAEYLTLHVGAGTFKPVKTASMGEHEMHAEFIEADEKLISSLIENKTIIAVGTTSLRSLESLYWLGVKINRHSAVQPADLHLEQWESYELEQLVPTDIALTKVLEWMKKNKLNKLITKTKLLIVPGYQLRVVDILVTNFHQPLSTLLLLVAAVAGSSWKEIYDYALRNHFRFLSYGDGCLIYT